MLLYSNAKASCNLITTMHISTFHSTAYVSWIPHWSMFIDFATQLRYMSRWGKCLGVQQWKNLAWLHMPWAFANLAVLLGHLHKDQCQLFKLLHPIFIFLGSISILFGTIQLTLHVPEGGSEEKKKLERTLIDSNGTITNTKGWDLKYSLSSGLFAAIFSYISLYVTPIFLK